MGIRQYLPSKQFSKFLGITLLIGVIVFVVLKIIQDRSSVRQQIQNIATRELIEQLDTDNDGLKDWEEALWGLDRNNPDTNGDGVLDGQEVEKRREELRMSEDFVDVSEEPKTETEKIARQILTVAMNINQETGGQLTEQQIMSIAESIFATTNSEGINFYTIEDLKINPTKSAQSYFNEMSQALAFLDSLPTNELLILEHAISTNRKQILEDLDPIIEAYASVPEKILSKEVPTQIAEAHLNYLNAITQKAIALISMTQYFDDPIIAVRGIQEYEIADQKIQESTVQIQQYLLNNGIVR